MTNRKPRPQPVSPLASRYDAMLSGVAGLLEEAPADFGAGGECDHDRHLLGDRPTRIVEFEQGGKDRAGYGEELLQRLSDDLAARFGRGFSRQNLQRFRDVYLWYSPARICSTLSGKSVNTNSQIVPTGLTIKEVSEYFLLPWPHYVRLMSLKNTEARALDRLKMGMDAS